MGLTFLARKSSKPKAADKAELVVGEKENLNVPVASKMKMHGVIRDMKNRMIR